jgi:regulator of telomere elongation helicase 1
MRYLFLQEGICAEAASFDLPAAHLTACIGEAKQCVDLASARKATDNGADTSLDPDNFAVLKGKSVSPIHYFLF